MAAKRKKKAAVKVKTRAKKPVKKVAKKAVKKTAKKAAKKSVKKPNIASLAGKQAPAFSMPTDEGKTVSLKDFAGKRVVLYFYPKDDTPGCTTQACAFRDMMPDFKGTGAVIIGVSKDSVASHKKFRTKYGLTFPLASDTSGVAEKYGVWKEKNMYGRKYMGVERSTFLIDESGVVRAEWRKVSVPGHADEVKNALQSL
jgi:peroxiredoxin Q/BCP